MDLHEEVDIQQDQIGLSPSTYIVRYPESNDLRLMTFSYLSGCDLFHKIALTSKSIRDLLPASGILDQVVVVTVKESLDLATFSQTNSFCYAIKLADSIQIQIDAQNHKYTREMYSLIENAGANLPKKILVDQIVRLKSISNRKNDWFDFNNQATSMIDLKLSVRKQFCSKSYPATDGDFMAEETYNKNVNGKNPLKMISLANGVMSNQGTLSFYGKLHFEGIEHCIFTEEQLVNDQNKKIIFDFGVFAQIQVLEIRNKNISQSEFELLIAGFSRIPSQSFRKIAIETKKIEKVSVQNLVKFLQSQQIRLKIEIRCQSYEFDHNPFEPYLSQVPDLSGFRTNTQECTQYLVVRYTDEVTQGSLNIFIARNI